MTRVVFFQEVGAWLARNELIPFEHVDVQEHDTVIVLSPTRQQGLPYLERRLAVRYRLLYSWKLQRNPDGIFPASHG